MNASPASAEDNGVCGSDSDSNSDDSPDYYQPISFTADSGASDEEVENISDHDPNPNFHNLLNGWVENGVATLDISDEDEAKEEEEATESERAIERAFREDEQRRNAPLTPDNAGRVMSAMRQISFGGVAPDWAGQVPEDEWIDRLRRLGKPSSSSCN